MKMRAALGIKRKKHGPNHLETLIDTDQLLDEAGQWGDGTIVNWTALGTKYGLTESNRGQVIKEYLANYNITVCSCPPERDQSREEKASRFRRQGIISHVSACRKQKEKVANKVTRGEILLGRDPPDHHDHQTNSVKETTNKVCAREIPVLGLLEIILIHMLCKTSGTK